MIDNIYAKLEDYEKRLLLRALNNGAEHLVIKGDEFLGVNVSLKHSPDYVIIQERCGWMAGKVVKHG